MLYIFILRCNTRNHQRNIHTIGRILKRVPYSIDNRWRVLTPSNVPIERSQRDLPASPFSLRVCPPLASDKSVSEPCLYLRRDRVYRYNGPTRFLTKRQFSVQAESSFVSFRDLHFKAWGLIFFSAKDRTVFSLTVSCFWMCRRKRM